MIAVSAPIPTRPLQAGDWVEVRSYEQITETLDAEGKLEGVPFMPEMARFCGRRLKVFRRVVKTCAVSGPTAIRRMHGTLHLQDARCDGAQHNGCQAACLLFWKEAWLQAAGGGPADNGPEPAQPPADLVTSFTTLDGQTAYVCQATELWEATCHLPWHDTGQYVRDVRAGNVTPLGVVGGFLATAKSRVEKIRRRVYGLRGRTPSERLDLVPGEWVEVKTRREIDATLDSRGHNRGLWWDPEMYQHCGKRLRVQAALGRVIDEGTGRMHHLKQPTVILEGVVCSGVYHRFCSRSNYVYWREIWLRRSPT